MAKWCEKGLDLNFLVLGLGMKVSMQLKFEFYRFFALSTYGTYFQM